MSDAPRRHTAHRGVQMGDPQSPYWAYYESTEPVAPGFEFISKRYNNLWTVIADLIWDRARPFIVRHFRTIISVLRRRKK